MGTLKITDVLTKIFKPKPAPRSSERNENMKKFSFPKTPGINGWRIWTQTWMIMRLATFFIIISTFTVSAKSYSQEVNISLKDVSVEKVFNQIREQTGFSFLWDENALEGLPSVSVTVHKATLKEALHTCLEGLPLTFDVHGKVVYIEREIVPKTMITTNIKSPVLFLKQITGAVTDSATGKPLVGVTIKVRGKNIGTVTDTQGEFSLEVPDDAVLEVTYVGYNKKSIVVNDRTSINISLGVAATGLNQLVVVGYGTQKKVNLTGAVSQISAEDLQNRPVTNMTQALQGEIPNLNIVIGSGKPGTSGTLNIRGNTSITGSGKPLVLIDGVPSEIDRVNINDVESITVLKDASASAIYGARAAFGVILVTTKSGSKGSPVISYNNNFGWNTFATNTNFMTSAYDVLRIEEEAYYNALGRKFSGFSEEDYDEIYKRRNDKTENPARPWVMIKPDRNGDSVYKYYGNTDWFKWFYAKWRPEQKHNLSVSGSSDKVNYYISGNLDKQRGVFRLNPDTYKRYNFMAKVETQLSSWLTISSNTRFFESDYVYYGKEGGMFPTVYNNITTNQIYMMTPNEVPINPDGTGTYLTDNGTYAIGYGAHLARMNKNLTGKNKVTDFTETIEGKIKITNDISITGNYTFNLENGYDMYRGVRLFYSLYPGVIDQVPRAEWNRDVLKETTNNNKYSILNVFGNYNKRFGNHNIKVTLGYNREERAFKTIYSEGNELLSESLNDLNLATGDQFVHGGASEWALSGTFYRVNYDYKGKYLFEASGRYDGTSRFKRGDRFGFFPSFSMGWRISDERFFHPLKNVVDNLKIRASIGSLGNQLVSTYAYIPTMPTSTLNYVLDGQRIIGVSSPNPVSPDLTWEMAISKNIGLDIDLLRNRLSLSLDGYIRDTKGMLTKGKTLAAVFGAPEPKENAADLRTKGFEISVEWRDQFNLFGKPFKYHVGINLSDYTAKITKFDNPSKILSDYYVGEKLGEIWGFVYDGYFKTNEEAAKYPVNQDLINGRRVQAPTVELRKLQAGDIKILDLDGNNKIDFGDGTVDNPGDRKIIGNSQPRYSFGIPLGGSWKGFDVNILFQGVVHQDYYPDLENQMFWGPYARPYGSFLPANFEKKIWRPDNPNSYFPRMIGYIAQSSELKWPNDMYLQDIGYMKLRNLTLGYTIPPISISGKIKIKYLRVYVSGENLLTWTRFDTDYIDPEEVMWDRTGRTYPVGKTYSLGIDVKF